ncbi:MAG: hypothetical protein ACRC1P_11320 [Cellulosilyticaceae bacterium]
MKWIIVIMIICTIGSIKSNDGINSTQEVFVSKIEDEWAIDLPEPYKTKSIINYKGFTGEGVSYSVLQYKEEDKRIINQLMRWKEKDNFSKNQVKKCFQFLEEWYSITAEERNEFNRYKQKLSQDYQYYYMKEMDGISYGIFIWLEEDMQMHIIDQTY